MAVDTMRAASNSAARDGRFDTVQLANHASDASFETERSGQFLIKAEKVVNRFAGRCDKRRFEFDRGLRGLHFC